MQIGTDKKPFSQRIKQNLIQFGNNARLRPSAFRGANPQQPLKNITQFRKQLGANTNDETYRILRDLSNTDHIESFIFTSEESGLGGLGEVLRDYQGQQVRVLFISCFHNPLTNTRRPQTIRDLTYNIPNTNDAFYEWWGNHSWDWRVSDSNVFDENPNGAVYITSSTLITPNHINQSFLDGEVHCVFTPIKEKIATLTEKSKKPINDKNKALLNKVIKLEKKYPNGVSEEVIDGVMKELKIKATIQLPFQNIHKTYGETEKNIMTMSYINTRLNHLDIQGDTFFNDNLQIIDDNEFDDKLIELDTNDIPYLYERNKFHTRLIRTRDTIYQRKSSGYGEEVKLLEEKYPFLRNSKICDITDPELSKFIRMGTKQTTSVKFENHRKSLIRNPKNKEGDYIKKNWEHIDQSKSYTRSKDYEFFEGFIGKITDFRLCDRIEGIGFYYISNIDFTRCNIHFKRLIQYTDIYRGKDIWSSVELKYLQRKGATFKIIMGAWGITEDFDFPTTFYEKLGDVPYYSIYTGCCNMTFEDTTHIYKKIRNEKDKQYASIIACEYPNTKILDDEMMITINKKNNLHLSHFAGFIYAYQRLNLLSQLELMDINKILRINTDGIYYLPHDFQLYKNFNKKDGSYIGLIDGEREQGFLTNTFTTLTNRYDLMMFKMKLAETSNRIHYEKEIFLGAGGTGKTHINLNDKGLHKALFCAVSHKLLADKMNEFPNIKTKTIAHILMKENIQTIIKEYNTLIIDECSMINNVSKNFILKTYKNLKIIFCGDIDCQVEPVEGKIMDKRGFDNITTLTINYRSNKELLMVLEEARRLCYDNSFESNLTMLKRIRREDIAEFYTQYDYILAHHHTTIDEINKIVEVKNIPKKVYMLKCGDDYNTGDVFYDIPTNILNNKRLDQTKYYRLTYGLTIHSVQGITIASNKIFIDEEVLYHPRILYTALSRAKSLDQIYMVKNPNMTILDL